MLANNGVAFETEPDQIDNPLLAAFLDIYKTKRRSRCFLRRDDLTPSELKACLPYMVLVDVLKDEGQGFRYRLIGTHVANYFGADVSGKTLEEAWPPEQAHARELIRETYQLLLKERCLMRFTAGAGVLPNGPAFDCLMAPLSEDDHLISMIALVFAFNRSEAMGKLSTSF